MSTFANIVLPLPLPPLTYEVPKELSLDIGTPVIVPLRKKTMSGIVVSLQEGAPKSNYKIQKIISLSDELPQLSQDILSILSWISEYYFCPMGEVLRTMLPPNPKPPMQKLYALTKAGHEVKKNIQQVRGKRQQELLLKLDAPSLLTGKDLPIAKKLIESGLVESFLKKDSFVSGTKASTTTAPDLNSNQLDATNQIQRAISNNLFSPFLLHGITGSGKTEVYLSCAAHALAAGKSVLIVVPEIALTPQLLARFSSRLGVPICVLHSGVSDGERSKQWHKLNDGSYRVCIGARSASLAPIKNLGLIIVDEEHDSALKQEDRLRYNARDLCLMRAMRAKCAIVLGSATPSLETFYNAKIGKYSYLALPERATGASLPAVRVVKQSNSKQAIISPALSAAITQALQRKEQVMLLLNRRGHASFLLCASCAFVPQCPNCSVSLTSYKNAHHLKCHYCGHSESLPAHCPKCASTEWLPGELGTESLESEIKSLFPDASILRIDKESTEKKGALEAALLKIADGSANIIIGTQIIAKGHDFPNISLVGVINADTAFHLPDFRATERSFQLFTQMAGRAGRGAASGTVLIQTYDPKHPSILHSTKHDYRSFAEQELAIRHAFSYPPYARLLRLIISAPTAQAAEKESFAIAKCLEKMQQQDIEIVGPAPAALFKIQNRYRWNILLKSKSATTLNKYTRTILSARKSTDRKIIIQVDVDPYSLM